MPCEKVSTKLFWFILLNQEYLLLTSSRDLQKVYKALYISQELSYQSKEAGEEVRVRRMEQESLVSKWHSKFAGQDQNRERVLTVNTQ